GGGVQDPVGVEAGQLVPAVHDDLPVGLDDDAVEPAVQGHRGRPFGAERGVEAAVGVEAGHDVGAGHDDLAVALQGGPAHPAAAFRDPLAAAAESRVQAAVGVVARQAHDHRGAAYGAPGGYDLAIPRLDEHGVGGVGAPAQGGSDVASARAEGGVEGAGR